MKKLTQIRLVNWYHILDETLKIDGSTLFMGDNGTGKSTILDAIQFALVADLNIVKFNQAANDNAARNLQGYTRWMTNSGGSKESSIYRRGDCTSYVILEFRESAANIGDDLVFTIGAVVDSFKDGRDPKRLHFCANQTMLQSIPVFRDESRFTLNTTEFRRIMATKPGFFASQEPGPFKDDLLIRLGKLSPDFTHILVKAQAFKPIGQVHQFVMDFLLDPRPLETESLQANLSNYKALEQKALEAEKRVHQLEKIADKRGELEKAWDEFLTFRYLELRAQAGIHEVELEQLSANLVATNDEHRLALSRVQLLSVDLHRCEQELGSVYRALSQNSAYLERERIKADLERTKAEILHIDAQINEIEQHDLLLKKLDEALRQALMLPEPDPSQPLTAFYHEVVYTSRKTRDDALVEVAALKRDGETARQRLDDLKKGVRPFPKEAKILKELIIDQIGCEAPLLCELIDVTDEHWQAAVEGYLNTRRFDIVLEPRYFSKALALYDRMKRQHNLHGVGLVDSEKVLAIKQRSKRSPLSLASIVTSENKAAKAYADFILGDVIGCESEQELRTHQRAITPTCMVYQNHAARQTPFHVFETWYIGVRGRTRLIEQTEKDISELLNRFRQSADTVARWDKILALASQAEDVATKTAIKPALSAQSHQLKKDELSINTHLSSINTDEVLTLEGREKALRLEKDRVLTERDDSTRVAARAEERSHLLSKQIIETSGARDIHFANLATEFGPSEELKSRGVEGQKRYQDELAKDRTPQRILDIFEPQRKSRETMRVNYLNELTLLRSEYNNQFGFSAPAQGEDLAPYLHELDAWKNSHLPEYMQKILQAKDAALQQLMEDIVHRLRENLDLIPSQFEQINRALRGFHFGFDQYQFTFRTKKEFEPFEKLIREAVHYEQQPLFETNWRERFRDGGALEALFESLVSGSSADVQKELAQYSDYREYYDYDLKILHSDGTESLFSQVNRWKSGGETQAPYYIAVLASLYRLYRLQGADGVANNGKQQRGTIGLVLLDEAFNKMDEDRLRATLQFTRKLGLQLIMATPKERADFIIPLVESCYIVAKDHQSGIAFLHDFHQKINESENHVEHREQKLVLEQYEHLQQQTLI